MSGSNILKNIKYRYKFIFVYIPSGIFSVPNSLKKGVGVEGRRVYKNGIDRGRDILSSRKVS